MHASGNHLLPLFLKLDHRTVLVVGGGPIALQKIEAIVANSPAASITVVAKDISPPVRAIAERSSSITLLEREYVPYDLDTVHLVIVAVNDVEIAERIYVDAHAREKLVNVVDTPGLCDFYFGAVLQKGNLKIAISTNGKSPTVAKRLRALFADLLPDEIDEVLEHLESIRGKLKGDLAAKVRKLNEITSALASNGQS